MKGFTAKIIAALGFARATAQFDPVVKADQSIQADQTTPSKYNGSIKYFIADIATSSPCHPKYERSYTWVDTSNTNSMDLVLDGLVRAGFNGIRLPMWPDDIRVRGPDPANEAKDIGKTFCDSLTDAWVKRIKSATKEQLYKDFHIYFSPGLDNKIF